MFCEALAVHLPRSNGKGTVERSSSIKVRLYGRPRYRQLFKRKLRVAEKILAHSRRRIGRGFPQFCRKSFAHSTDLQAGYSEIFLRISNSKLVFASREPQFAFPNV